MGRLSNIPLRVFREFLEFNGLKPIRTKGGHEIWAGKSLQRPIVLQSHKSPVPEFIVRQSLRALNKTEQDFIDFFSN
ncbi:MAG: type II toxin-antitoxin system HicA family toxin [Bacteroidales bacterium]|nr:type II toxin-antitoxin system HicA family toxin [Bacteroidales bacterium]